MSVNAQGLHPEEDVLPDDHPVHPGYCYVRPSGLDGYAWFVSMIGGTVRDLKYDVDTTEIRRCNMAARDLL